MDSIDTEKLVLKIQNGDKDAFGEIYDNYVDKIYRFILFKVSSQEQAEDLTSEVFLKFLEKIEKDKENGEIEIDNLLAFLFKMARNLVIDFYRKSENSAFSLDDFDFDITDENGNLADQVQLKDDISGLQAGLKKIKESYREVVILYYLEGFSIEEIADILEKNQGAIRVQIHRAMKALKKELSY
jgi:RNA polymerase sigma-70 factor (ECF subfamily)